MTPEQILKKIKDRGYWVVNFHPTKYASDLISTRSKAKQIIQDCSVALRGWNYPPIPDRNDETTGLCYGADYVEGYIDWWHKELWRFYQSGQFVHYLGLQEDWLDENKMVSGDLKNIKPGSILDVTNTIYSLTEIFEFLNRLARKGIYGEGVVVRIKLVGVQDRELQILSPGRMPLLMKYKASVEEIAIPKKELNGQDVLSRSQDLALEVVQYIFETFGWEQQPIEIFKADQQKLLERRF